MKHFMYSVFDRASGIYERPFCARSDMEAMRSFSDIAVSKDHPIGQHPDDYTLFRVGTYDDNKGQIVGEASEKIINGAEAVASSQSVESVQDSVAKLKEVN